jgi:2,5-diketo-D-gluconate reductase A
VPRGDLPPAALAVLVLGPAGTPQSMSSSTSNVPSIPLRGDVHIPQLGFGVFQVPPEDTAEATTRALLTGYRHIDTAAAYRNEAEVGQAVHASGLDREDVFITTKCFNDDHGFEQAQRAFKASLGRLELDHLDLYLIHWPVPAHDRYVETWKAFIELQSQGLVRAIGVSNFQPAHLERIIEETGVPPAVNQVELHPRFQQAGLRREHAELGIVTEAWSPLAQGGVLGDPVINEIAEAHGKTPAQVVIRWHLQLGNVVIPKSVTPERIEENFDVLDFHLGDGEMEAIEELDAGERTGPDPDTFVRP